MSHALIVEEALLNRPGGETHFILSNTSQMHARQQLRALENAIWVTPLTAKVEVLLPTYNTHLGMLTATYILFFFNPGGRIHKLIESRSMWLKPYHGWYCYAADISWLCFVANIIVGEVAEVRATCKRFGTMRGLRLYLNFSNLIDWFNVSYSLLIIVVWLRYMGNLSDIRDYIDKGAYDVVGTWNESSDRIGFFDLIDTTVLFEKQLRSRLAVYPFVLLSRFFKTFEAQPRLSVVTKTLMNGAVDVFHFSAVFLTVFMIFSISAMMLFGTEIQEFSEITRAMNSVFVILLGDFDWETMSQSGRMKSGAWFWMFNWLLTMVMLNMLLAMIMDVYTEVKGGLPHDAETIWSQVHSSLVHGLQLYRGDCISFHSVFKALDLEDVRGGDKRAAAREAHTVETLIAAVPLLGQEQASEILRASHSTWLEKNRETRSLSFTLRAIHDVRVRLESFSNMLQQTYELFGMGMDALLASVAAGQQQEATAPADGGSVAAPEDSAPSTGGREAPRRAAQEEIALETEALSKVAAADMQRLSGFISSAQRLSQPTIAALRHGTTFRREQVRHFSRLEQRLVKMEAMLKRLSPEVTSHVPAQNLPILLL
eukprot:NODE_248_length_3296_cov_7.873462.p1 GENE.NODE_248_length_3296_cov_7.873462~~NODE_248_length_3296_cov_7.873462.p1  ORF type:complete len:598 (-),score=132.90 NODE_248_length_3296_cov_7.873462:201-1994(-)